MWAPSVDPDSSRNQQCPLCEGSVSKMPMYLDRHDLVGITAQEIADAHLQDLEAQDKHSVRYHTYWFDEEKGSIFCLAEGPSRQAVEDVHRESHGQLASWVLELDQKTPLNAYMGGLPSHPAGTAYTESAMRVIVFTDMCGSVAQTHLLGDDGHVQLLREHDEIVRAGLDAHHGREVKHTGDGIMSAFNSAVSAITFATDVQRKIDARNEVAALSFHVSIGISGGEPVTNANDDLFGATVQIAARLCAAAEPGDINVSVAIYELCVGKPIRFQDCGQLRLKGLPEPVQSYSVDWRHNSPR